MERPDFLDLLGQFNKSGIPESINFDLMNEILISYHSTAIEGSSLTEEESRVLILEGITAKGKPLHDHNMVRDHQDALDAVLQFSGDRKPVTPELIQAINAMVMKTTGTVIHSMAGSYDSSKGDFRKSMVHVGARYFSDYQKVPSQVEELCRLVNEHISSPANPCEIYDLAFDTHFKLVSIHPFADGNGRTSRLLSNFILHWHGQPLSIVYKEDKGDYFNALEEARNKEDINIFRNFMYSQQMKYFVTEIGKITKS